MANKTTAYFAPLIALPTLISAPGSYVTRDGKVVSVSAVSDHHDFGCIGTYHNGIRESWHRSGRILATSETANDIVGSAEVAA